jgi:hypothetical protein
MSELQEAYLTQPANPESLATVTIPLNVKWYNVLQQLWRLERAGAQIAAIHFTRGGPKVLKVENLDT